MATLRSRVTLAHGFMLVAAFVTFVSVASILRERSETTAVPVARVELAAGAILDDAAMAEAFEFVQVRADSPLLVGVVDPTTMPSGQLTRSIHPGQALVRGDVVEVGADGTARTFTMAVDAVTLNGLGLAAGDRVDVIGALDDGTYGFVVADVRVARLPTSQQSAGAFAVRADGFVTIEVDDMEALALAAALGSGDVVVVRSTGAAALTVAAPQLSGGTADPADG